MNPTHSSDRDDGPNGRAFAMRDVRFAGTVAAGLVAGVLGVGALTAPLLGWTEWPSSPGSSDQAGTVTLRERTSATPVERPSTGSIGKGAIAISPVALPAAGVSGVGVGPSVANIRLT